VDKSEQKELGWKWLVEVNWTRLGMCQKLWFGQQISRFGREFGLSLDERRKLNFEIAERWKSEITLS